MTFHVTTAVAGQPPEESGLTRHRHGVCMCRVMQEAAHDASRHSDTSTSEW
jgi:hypothetical protein